MLKVLCGEPLCYKPWEVARLTPSQVKHTLMVERGKDGAVKLDEPLRRREEELSVEREWRVELGKVYTDPDAITLLAGDD